MAIATINPATGQTIKTFEPLTDSQVDQKIARAAEVFRGSTGYRSPRARG